MANSGTQQYVVGVDAGNTKTVVAVADLSGRVHGYARGGSGNIYAGLDRTVTVIHDLYKQALTHAELHSDAITHLTISATGADWPEDFAAIREAVCQRYILSDSANLSVVNDAVGALWAGSASGEGVVVAAGTSAGTAARWGERVWHSSYWQQTEGAVELGQKGLRAVYLAELGLASPTSLTRTFLDVLKLPSTEALLHAFTARTPSLDVGDAGRLARIVLTEAETGDGVAIQLAAAHGAALGDFALVAARKVGLEGAVPLVLTGGLMRHAGATLKDALTERVRTQLPHVVRQDSSFEPVGGALCMALAEVGCYTSQTRDALRDTLPHVTFFAT